MLRVLQNAILVSYALAAKDLSELSTFKKGERPPTDEQRVRGKVSTFKSVSDIYKIECPENNY